MSDRDVTAKMKLSVEHLKHSNSGVPEETPEAVSTVRCLWEPSPDQTVRISFAAPSNDDVNDGVPKPIEAETSATVSIHVVDLEEALLPILQLAQRDQVSVGLIRTYDARPRASHAVPVDIQNMTGDEKVEAVINGLAITVMNWKKFSAWFKTAIEEAEVGYFKNFHARKASAIVFRLKLLAEEILKRTPPHNHLVMRLED